MEAQLREHQALLADLYVNKNKSLAFVINHMRTHFALTASKSTYEQLFRQWGLRKNKKGDHWNYVDHKLSRRRAAGKESVVYVDGQMCPPGKVQKEISRHVTTIQQCSRNSAPSPATPEGFSVVTPASMAGTPGDTSAASGCLPAAHEETLGSVGGTANAAPQTNPDKAMERLLVDQMKTCGAFIRILAHEKHATSPRSLEAFYTKMAASLATVIPLEAYSSESDPTALTIGFDIVAMSLRDDAGRLQSLLQGADQVLYKDVLHTAMFLAARKGCIETISIILDFGVKVDALDSAGSTCLQIAAIENHPETVRYLLSKGAVVDHENRLGTTAWTDICYRSTHDEVADILLSHGATRDRLRKDSHHVLYRAAAGGHVDHVRVMLQRGMNPSFRTPFRWCPLHWAVSNGHPEVVQLLLEAGADVNSRSDTGKTPLGMLHEGSSHRERIEALLLPYGAHL